MAWIGITNENEFYSDHYLNEIFSGDVKQQLDAWNQREEQSREKTPDNPERAPYKQFASLSQTALQTFKEPGSRNEPPKAGCRCNSTGSSNCCKSLVLTHSPSATPSTMTSNYRCLPRSSTTSKNRCYGSSKPSSPMNRTPTHCRLKSTSSNCSASAKRPYPGN